MSKVLVSRLDQSQASAAAVPLAEARTHPPRPSERPTTDAATRAIDARRTAPRALRYAASECWALARAPSQTGGSEGECAVVRWAALFDLARLQCSTHATPTPTVDERRMCAAGRRWKATLTRALDRSSRDEADHRSRKEGAAAAGSARHGDAAGRHQGEAISPARGVAAPLQRRPLPLCVLSLHFCRGWRFLSPRLSSCEACHLGRARSNQVNPVNQRMHRPGHTPLACG